MNHSNVFGCHAVFYYYGIEHLALNLSFYIMEGLKHNDLMYISMEPELFRQVMETSRLKDWQSAVRQYSLKELIVSFNENGLAGLKQVVNRLTEEAKSEGYNGIRFIGHSQFSLMETSLEEFLAWESGLNEALRDTQFALMCLYDIKDLLHGKAYLNHQIIAHSLSDHPYIFYQLQLKDKNSLSL